MTLTEHNDDRLVFKGGSKVLSFVLIGMALLLAALGPLIWEEEGLVLMIVAYAFAIAIGGLGVLQLFTKTTLTFDRHDQSIRYVRRQLGRRYTMERALDDIRDIEIETRSMGEDSSISKLHFRPRDGSGETTMTVLDFPNTEHAEAMHQVMTDWMQRN